MQCDAGNASTFVPTGEPEIVPWMAAGEMSVLIVMRFRGSHSPSCSKTWKTH